MLAAACVPRSDSSTAHVVERFHAAWRAGDLERLHGLVDYRYRLEEVLGDVWAEASEADRELAVRQAREMLEDTTGRYWTTHFEGRTTTTRVTERDGPHVWIEVEATGGEAARFSWIYRLTRDGSQARISQREFTVGSMGSDTSAFYPLVLRRVGAELGRTPTLAELNANLPSLVGRIKKRSYTVPESPSRSEPP